MGNDEYRSEAAQRIADLYLQIDRENVVKIASSEATPKTVRAKLYYRLASEANTCGSDVTGNPANQITVRVNSKPTTRYKMPVRKSDYDKAKECAESGLEYAEKGLEIDSSDSGLWSAKASLRIISSRLAEMASDAANKDAFAKRSEAASSGAYIARSAGRARAVVSLMNSRSRSAYGSSHGSIAMSAVPSVCRSHANGGGGAVVAVGVGVVLIARRAILSARREATTDEARRRRGNRVAGHIPHA